MNILLTTSSSGSSEGGSPQGLNLLNLFKPWLSPSEEPGDDAVRILFTEAMRVVLSFIMENHLYTFDGQIKLQSKGGPIGLQLTGVLAQLFMVW